MTIPCKFAHVMRSMRREAASRGRRSVSSFLIALLFASALVTLSLPQTALAAGNISGTVYRDYNGNGIFNSGSDFGVGGITVTAYDANNGVIATATSSASFATMGQYTLTSAALTALAANTPLRIEFTNIPAALKPGVFGTGSGTTVQFVNTTAGALTNINCALSNPGEYTSAAPSLVTTCYIEGHMTTQGTGDVIPSYIYTAGGTSFPGFDTPTPAIEATGQNVGACYGLAYRRNTDTLYAGAYMKRHTGLGPSGIGAIYAIPNIASPATSAPTLFATIPNAGTDTHPTLVNPPAPNTWRFDTATFHVVGKRGLGDVEMSEDDSRLYVVNLNDKHLYEVPIPASGMGTPIDRGLIPRPATVTAADARPFAIAVRDGIVYVGGAGSAESTQNVNDLRAYVYTFDPATNNFSATPVIDFPLNYPRRCADVPPLCNGGVAPAAWRPWFRETDPIPNFANLPNDPFVTYPQPMLTGITFINDEMVIGLRDRMGDQGGSATGNAGLTSDGTDYYIVTAGDTLRATPNGSGGWTLESNGASVPAGRFASAGSANDTEGPGTGEFYFHDNHVQGGGSNHDEVSSGSLIQIPGFPDIAVTAMDPLNETGQLFDGGVMWLSNTAGTRTRSYRLFDSNVNGSTFAKANGLGDIEPIIPPAPLEIGNRVWNDLDGDGVQDAGEPAMDGIAVQLWVDTNCDGTVDTQVGQALTANGGQYYFGGATNRNMIGTTTTTVTFSADTSGNDAEENAGTGAVDINNTSLALGRLTAGGTQQRVGLRFSNVTVPNGAVVTNATIQFQAAGGDASTTTLRIQAEDTNDAALFTTTANNISGRTLTAPFVDWTVPSWANNQNNASTATPNLATLVQNVVSRTGWAGGNDMAFVVNENGNSGSRRVDANDGTPNPVLSVTYYTNSQTLNRNTCYQVRVDTTQSALANRQLTNPNNDATANGDSRDSDPALVSSTAVFALTTGLSGNNDHTVDIGFRNRADLSLTKSVSPSTQTIGLDVTFTIPVTNNGPLVAHAVVVRDMLPAGFFFISSSATQGSYNSTTGLWTVGTLNVGQTATLTITATVTTLGGLTNEAEIQYAGSFDIDSTPNNDIPGEDDQDEEPVTPQASTLARFDDFEATTTPKGIVLDWRTSYEVDNLGFNIYREVDGNRQRVNPSIIAGSALIAGANVALTAGRAYRWLDRAPRGEARYWLEAIDLDGSSTWHGPVIATAGTDKTEPGETSPVLEDLNLDRPGGFLTEGVASEAATKGARAAKTPQQTIASRQGLKIGIREAGWYRLTPADFVSAGLDPTRTDPRTLKMFVDGVETQILVYGEQDGRFDPSDAIEFYATGVDLQSTDTRVYWLVSDPGKPATRIKTLTGTATQGISPSYPFFVELKERLDYFSSLANGQAENFFGQIVLANVSADHLLPIRAIDTQSPTARVEVSLQGVTVQGHAVNVSLNGQSIGTVNFANKALGTATFDVPSSLLVDGDNTVSFQSTNGDGDISLVHFVRITYLRRPVASGDAVTASFATRAPAYTIDGFTGNAIRAFDITAPDRVVELRGVVAQSGSGFAVTVPAAAGGARRVFALTEANIKTPASIVANIPSQLSAPTNAADLVVIAYGPFLDAANQVATLRRGQGYRTMVVDVEDVYDEYGFGIHGSASLRAFLADAKANWSVKPRYVLLVGDGSYDPRNYFGQYGATNLDLVPSRLVDTGNMETASDDWFVDFNDDTIPEMAIGRLPASTVAEASALAAKVIAYDQALGNRTAVFLADSNDTANFEAHVAAARALMPPGYTSEEILSGPLGYGEARNRLLTALDAGAGIVHYSGHGSVDLWRGGLLMSSDAAARTNTRQSIFVVANCLNGYYQDPFLPCLGEAFLKEPDHGAVAVWASAGMTAPDLQTVMLNEFYRQLFSSPSMTIGDATRLAKAATQSPEVRRSWVLLGDPLTRIAR